MSLSARSQLAHYEIVASLGAGAMGEVYQARDTRLGREVAIKVLPEHFAEDDERLKRFEREARSLASLNHPNVAQIFGVEQAQGIYFLVLELVPGESLEERMRRGPLPLSEALDACRQIAEGLEAAHEAGVIHRDLKPANVRITPDGKVKLLDFGLAKSARSGEAHSSDSVLSTEQGRLIGTPVYMAPEQARGKPVDRRVDIWAFGCVLFESLTGRRVFTGESLSDVLASVLHDEPKLEQLPAATPRRVRELIARCLIKDPRERLRDIGDARIELERAQAGDDEGTSSASARSAGGQRLAWSVAAVCAAIAVGAFWFASTRKAGVEPIARAVRASLQITDLGSNTFGTVARISPNGRTIVVGGVGRQTEQPLYLYAIDGERARAISGTEGAQDPFWSPDSTQVGFFQQKWLKRVAISGGDPFRICTIEDDSRGGAWNSGGTILFSPARAGGLMRVPATGGATQPATSLDASRGEQTHRWPQFLPDGEHFLFWASDNANGEKDAVRLGSLDSDSTKVVIENASNALYSSGHLLFTDNRRPDLVAQPFDLTRGLLTGTASSVASNPWNGMEVSLLPISVDECGDLLYLEPPSNWSTEIGWFDRSGVRHGTLCDPGPWSGGRISPDGRRAIAPLTDLKSNTYRTDLWMIDLASGERSRFTFDEGDVAWPAWSPDGQRVAWGYIDEKKKQLRVRAVAGGPTSTILELATLDNADLDWSPDGASLAFAIFETKKGRYEIHTVDLESRATRRLIEVDSDARQPRFSPDGKFLAYTCGESGRDEVYVNRLADGRQWQLSTDGGSMPRWSKTGKELFFLGADDRLLTVTARLGDDPGFGAPLLPPGAQRFTASPYFYYEVAQDGEQILADAPPANTLALKVRIIVDWPALLNR